MMLLKTIRIAAWAILVCAALGEAGEAGRESGNIVLESEHVRYVIGPAGKNLGFIDKRTGKDYCAVMGERNVMLLKKKGKSFQPTACGFTDGRLSVVFGEAGVTVVVKVTSKPHWLVFEVESLSDPEVDELDLSILAVTSCKYVGEMSGVAADDEFAVCLRALNLQVQGQVGGRPAVLRATCCRKYGLAGAKLALIGCAAGQLRVILKDLVRQEGLPYSPLGGPWALEAEENRDSYLFAGVSAANVDRWIAAANKAHVRCLHFIGWERSPGHYQPRADLFPGGLDSIKAVVDRIHAAGLKAGMHTMTGCISPNDPWVTPVPDKRLGVDAALTLAESLSSQHTTVLTVECPPPFDTVWGFSNRGNVIRIDDELILIGGLSCQIPYGLTRCTRGAFGTQAAAHAKGSPIHKLNVRWGYFHPDEDSTLVDDLAEAIARVFNACGFDMIYMDGITEDTMTGGWHAAAKMRAAIFQRLKQPVLVEASCWNFHSWPFHSRIGAWDHPVWGLKRFVDVHCRLGVLDVDGRTTERFPQSSLLPAQLGWWVILGPSRDYPGETPDEMEYLCVKSLAYDAPVSFQGVNVDGHPWNVRQDEYLELFGRYERLRLARYFPDSIRNRLREDKADFHLIQSPQGSWQFVPADYTKHKVTGQNDGTDRWGVTNRFAAQPLQLRIEALYSVEPYDTPQAPVLADFARTNEFDSQDASADIRHELSPSTEQVQVGGTSGRYWAKNAGSSRNGAWTRVGKTFSPERDLSNYDALGLWIHGDGMGHLLNLQLANPPGYWLVRDEHYIKVDFRGWRYFELLFRERDAESCGDYVWPYGPLDHYAIYRSPLVRNHISGLSLYFNHLPAQAEARCYLSPIKALKTVKIKLQNPAVEIGGARVIFPLVMESGAFLEWDATAGCKHYDERGGLVGEVKPQGQFPRLAAGGNRLRFACEGPSGFATRAQVTVISFGEPLLP